MGRPSGSLRAVNREALHTRIQLLLSWREKASRLLRETRQPIAPARGHYRAHIRQAEYYLIRTVDEQHGLVDKLGAELHAALGEIGRIEQRASSGRIREEDAAMAKSEVERRVERLRDEVTFYNQLLRAKRSHEIGGFIDLPIDQYAPRLGILPVVRSRVGWQTRHYVGIAVLALVAALASYTYYQQAAAPSLACEGTYRATPLETLILTLRNDGNLPLRMRVPWPTPVPAGLEPADCGLKVYARLGSRDSYQLVPTSSTDWRRLGAPMTGVEFVSVPPGVEESVELDVHSLRTRLGDIAAMRIESSTALGDILCDKEWDSLSPASGQ